jgi:hypothetical protein
LFGQEKSHQREGRPGIARCARPLCCLLDLGGCGTRLAEPQAFRQDSDSPRRNPRAQASCSARHKGPQLRKAVVLSYGPMRGYRTFSQSIEVPEETLVSVERLGLLFVYVLATVIYLVAMSRAYNHRGKEGGLPADAGFFRAGWLLYPFRYHAPLSRSQRRVLWSARISFLVAVVSLWMLLRFE